MKKFLVLLGLFLGFILVGCDKKDKLIEDKNVETMAVQTISSILLMDNYTNTLRLNSSDKQEAINVLKKAYVMVGSKLTIKEEKSDRNEYSLMYQIEYNDDIYTMYVTDIRERIENEVDEEEVTTKINGIVLYDGNEYPLEVTKKSEKELNESEEELELKVIFSQGNYVKVSQEIEEEAFEKEETFAYEIVRDGKKVEDFEVTREVEGKREKIKVEVMNQEYEFREYQKGNDSFIDVEIEDGPRFTLKVVRQEVDGNIIIDYEIQ